MPFRLILLTVILLLSINRGHATSYCLQEHGCWRFTAVGHGVVMEQNEQPLAHRQLLAIRAAKLDAVRSLAEQVHGFRIVSATKIATNSEISDEASMHLDTILSGVRYIKVEPLQQNIYQAVVEIEIRQ